LHKRAQAAARFAVRRLLCRQSPIESKEMIMGTISGIAAQRAGAAAIGHTVAGAMGRWWVAYMTWRIERLAIARLRTISDRQLEDMGIVRSQIELEVKGEIARNRVFRPL
jgi:uncharacterized protein YjiS (DUF1127 family)